MSDLTLPTRDGDVVTLTQARFTREGVAELAIEPEDADLGVATVVTAAQARTLATALDTLAREWGA